MAHVLSLRRLRRRSERERRSTVRAVEAPAARSEVPSPGRWIRPGRKNRSGIAKTTARLRLAACSSSDTIRWRPRADPGQKRDAGGRIKLRKGLTPRGPLQKRFFKRLLAGLRYRPKRIITDGLRSYGVAQRAILPDVRHRSSRHLNNRAENSHRPTRRRERQMQRFKSSQQAQRFLSSHSMIYGHFRPRRHLMTAAQYRRTRAKAFRTWRQETCVQTAG